MQYSNKIVTQKNMETFNNISTSPPEKDLDVTIQNNFDDMEMDYEAHLDEIENFFRNDFEANFLEDINF